MTSSRKFAIRPPRSERPRGPKPPPPEPEPLNPTSLVVGVLVGPFGIAGEVKLRPLTEFPERLPRLKALRLLMPDGAERTLKVKNTRWHKEMLLVRLEGVGSREDAEDLRDAQVLVEMDQAAPLPEGRFYEHQLIGLRVVTPEGEELGRVREVMAGASNDVYIAGPYMIPATHDAIIRLDPQEGVIVVRSRAYIEGEEVR